MTLNINRDTQAISTVERQFKPVVIGISFEKTHFKNKQAVLEYVAEDNGQTTCYYTELAKEKIMDLADKKAFFIETGK